MPETASPAAPPKWRAILMRIIENCKVKSRDLASGLDGAGSKITLWGSQQRFLDNLAQGMDEGVRVFICLKSRQLGITTLCLILDVAWCAMFPGINAALVVHNGDAKEKMRIQVQDIVKSFPDKFFGAAFAIKKGQNNREFIGFTNGSRINFVVAGEKDAEKETFGDGSGYTLVHLTEVALYGSAKALASFEQSFSTSNPNRLIIYESRAAGFNHWREMWVNAGRDFYTIRRMFIGWWSRSDQIIPRTDRRFPLYGLRPPDGEESELMNIVWHHYKHLITPEQLAWYRWKAADEKMTREIMHAQQPWTETQAFVAGGYSFFANKDVAKDLAYIYDNQEEHQYRAFRYIMGNDFFSTYIEQLSAGVPEEEMELRVWEGPVRGAKYVLGVDPAFGRNDNKDRHAISIWRCYADKLVQVAEYADHKPITEQAAWVMCHLAGNYEDCLINLELSGGPGHLFMQALDHVRQLMGSELFANIVRERKLEEFLTSARWYLYHRPDSMGAGYVWNTQTTGNTKLPLMEGFRGAHRGGHLIIRSPRLLKEMMDIRQEGIKVEAPGRNKDDRVVSGALAVQAWKQWVQPNMIATGQTYEAMTRQETGGSVTMGDVLNRIATDYMAMREAQEMEAPRAPKWMLERGLA